MRKLILLIILLFALRGFSQSYTTVAEIDSAFNKAFKKTKVVKDKTSTPRFRYWFKKKTGALLLVASTSYHQSLMFYYIDSSLVLIKFMLVHPVNKQPSIGRYYFSDGKIIKNIAINLPPTDTAYLLKLGKEYYQRGRTLFH